MGRHFIDKPFSNTLRITRDSETKITGVTFKNDWIEIKLIFETNFISFPLVYKSCTLRIKKCSKLNVYLYFLTAFVPFRNCFMRARVCLCR